MLYNNWWKNAGKCSGDEKQGEKRANPLGVANVGGTFVILVAGLAMAAVVAVLEFVWYYTRSSHRGANHDNQVKIFHRRRWSWVCNKDTIRYDIQVFNVNQTSRHAVAKRPRDASRLSVVSFNSTIIRRVQYFT